LTPIESTVTTPIEEPQGFALWITGLPACGKSTLAAALVCELRRRSVSAVVLESDVVRRILTPRPRYTEQERDFFYQALLELGILLTRYGIPVIFDATANRRRYREQAREQIPHFLEVYVECPLEVCMERDPKGIYRKGKEGSASRVPGLQACYEPPLQPEITVQGEHDSPQEAAFQIVAVLEERGLLAGRTS
jgi:adenylylsulfate kinase